MKQLIVSSTAPLAVEMACEIADDFINKKHYLENNTHIITWCGNMDLTSQCEKGIKHQLGVLKALCVRHDVSEIINACEADSHQAMVFDLIYQYFKPPKIYRNN